MASNAQLISQTLSSLEERLRRINFVVHGDRENADLTTRQVTTQHQNPPTVQTRLRNLERGLQHLAAKSYSVSDVLALHRLHPDLFHASTGDAPVAPTTLPLAALAQLILAHDQLYQTSLSQLNHLKDANQIPDSAPLSKLITLQTRIDQAREKQASQAAEVATLRARSAAIVEKWYERGILEMGERWAEWEEKLRDCEILVRRREAARKRENGMA